MIFQYINVCPVPREMLKTSAYGLGFQHLPRDLANVNAWNTMFDPYIEKDVKSQVTHPCYAAGCMGTVSLKRIAHAAMIVLYEFTCQLSQTTWTSQGSVMQ